MSDHNLPREFTPEEAIRHFSALFPDEEWKPVPGWPAYEMSSQGQLKSYWKRSGNVRKGELKMIIGTTGKILKPLIEPRYGHRHYRLADGNGGYETLSAARLVLMTFDRLPVPGEQARHYYDPTPSNLNAWNLRWGTRFDNAVDSIRHKGGHHLAKLDAEGVQDIRRMLAAGIPQKEIAAEKNISVPTVSQIKTGRIWKHLEPERDEEPISPPPEPGFLPGFQ